MPAMDAHNQRARFAAARVAHLATVGQDGAPHVVPVVFALLDDVIYSAIDHKPKTKTDVRRLANIRATGRASVMVDSYDEDWTRLWWVRVDGAAVVVDATSTEGRTGVDVLVDKYQQYQAVRPSGPVVAVRVTRWTGWQFSA